MVGGVESLLATLAVPFADVRSKLAGYAGLEPSRRRAHLEEALALLAQGSLAAQGGSTAAGGTRHDAAVAGALEEPLALDQRLSDGGVDLGAAAAKKLAPLGIKTYRDLLYLAPRRHEDRRATPRYASLVDGQVATVVGTVVSRKGLSSRRGMHVLRAVLEDAQGERITAVWFNQPWVEKQIFPRQRVILTGKVKRRGNAAEVMVQGHEVDDDTVSLSFGRIVGVYPGTPGLSQAYVRRAVHRLLDAVDTVPDYLPRSLLKRRKLVSLDRALRDLHFPHGTEGLSAALRRLKFDEFLFLELVMLRSRDPSRLGRRFDVRSADLDAFRSSLPFDLTSAQDRALTQILDDMAAPRQMARLLQGDVGSGKTAVAAAAIVVAARNGAQAALMAPTEILARQHYLNLRRYLYPLGIRMELLIGSMTGSERRAARGRVTSGEVDVAVGTHALIQQDVDFRDLGLAVIDEEHRFGVEQRRALVKGMPDVLVMSATPIPRSLALTQYGDLELTVIDGLPPGRTPVKTVLRNASKRAEVYHAAAREIAEGRQVFLVTPLIEASEALEDVVSTTQMFEDLRVLMPQSCRIEMLHGRMPGAEKDGVMERFRRHEFDMLVSTTVIEVGVDVPNATMMIVENAERFGLSQLHQLRGRVGRGSASSVCVLIAGQRGKKTQGRLDVLVKHTDGFEIAEFDLRLRGPGELRGTRQSGVPELSIGDLSADGAIIEEAREVAKRILEADPDLRAAWATRLRAELGRRSRNVAIREVI